MLEVTRLYSTAHLGARKGYVFAYLSPAKYEPLPCGTAKNLGRIFFLYLNSMNKKG